MPSTSTSLKRTVVLKKRATRTVLKVDPVVERCTVATATDLDNCLRQRGHRGIGSNELDERGLMFARAAHKEGRIEFVNHRYYERFVGEIASPAFMELWRLAVAKDAASPSTS